MTKNNLIRQLHRWLSIAFVVCVVATTFAMARKPPIVWMSYVPLAPLALLSITGLYLFALPYLAKRGGARGAAKD